MSPSKVTNPTKRLYIRIGGNGSLCFRFKAWYRGLEFTRASTFVPGEVYHPLSQNIALEGFLGTRDLCRRLAQQPACKFLAGSEIVILGRQFVAVSVFVIEPGIDDGDH